MNLYLELMKKCLLNLIYVDPKDLNLVLEGKTTLKEAHTMIGWKRLNNVQVCIEEVIKNNIEGDFVEAGVWNGGTTIFMRSILKTNGITNRKVWVADSFEGCPIPNPEKYPQDTNFNLFLRKDYAISLDQVKSNFAKYDLLDEQVCFLQGWFKDTLPFAPIEKLALLRVDGDLYESTMDVMTSLYPKLSIGGYVIIDDYNCYPPCKQAITDYCKEHNIQDEIKNIDWTGVYWKKSK